MTKVHFSIKYGRKTVSNKSCEYHQSKTKVIDSFAHKKLTFYKRIRHQELKFR